MPKLVSTVPKHRSERFGVPFPEGWEISYIGAPYTDEALVRACEGADYLYTMSAHPVPGAAILQMPGLKLIQVEGVGYEKVDLDAARGMGITVCNNRGVNNGAVAEHTIGMFLAGLRRMAACDAQIKTEGYAPAREEFLAIGHRELAGRRVGLVGFGDIGRAVAARLKGWECDLRYHDARRAAPEQERELGARYEELDALLAESDIVSLHVPVLPATLHMIAAPQLRAMKKTALLVNTARGELIDQAALAQALEAGEIYGAALDTFEPEPVPDDHPLLRLSPKAAMRLTMSPHVAGLTDESFTRMQQCAIANMQKMERGERPDNVVS